MNHIWGSLMLHADSQCTLEWLGQVYIKCAKAATVKVKFRFVHFSSRNARFPEKWAIMLKIWLGAKCLECTPEFKRSNTFFCDGKRPTCEVFISGRGKRESFYALFRGKKHKLYSGRLSGRCHRNNRASEMKSVTTHTFLALCGAGISKSTRCECL